MKPAQERIAPDLRDTVFHDLQIPLVNNWLAREVTTGGDARVGLSEQIPNPVRWTDTIRLLVHRGITRFVEVGAGSVLTGLCRSIDPTLQGAKFGEPGDLEKMSVLLDQTEN